MGNALSNAQQCARCQFCTSKLKAAVDRAELVERELDEKKSDLDELKRVFEDMKLHLDRSKRTVSEIKAVIATPTEELTKSIFETRGNIYFYDDALERRNYDNAVDYMKGRVQRCLEGTDASGPLEKIDEVST